MKIPYCNKEISWLSFNERVLQEAEDKTVSLAARIAFLGIYSSNLDEFFRVRVASLLRLLKEEKTTSHKNKYIEIEKILKKIAEIEISQRIRFEKLSESIIKELSKKNINIIKHTELNEEQRKYVIKYFNRKVRQKIFPMMIDKRYKFPILKDMALYLAVEMTRHKLPKKYSIIEIPTKVLPRFVLLPSKNNSKDIILIDEIVRVGLSDIYKMLKISSYHSYNIKITRDAGLYMEDDILTSYIDQLSKSLKKRKLGPIVRFVYDQNIPQDMFEILKKKLKLKKIKFMTPGGRYHYFKDFMELPKIARLKGTQLFEPIKHKLISGKPSILEVIRKQDILLHFPYHSFSTFIDFLREASIDPRVISIKITLYRVAKFSSVVNALINAVRNRKKVFVVVEVQARFDEESNIYWLKKLKEEGASVFVGIKGLKVHSKLCLVTRENVKGELEYYSNIGTGNFHEDTAKLYTDSYLLTANREIGREVESIFKLLEKTIKINKFRHLIVSPLNVRTKFFELIKNEIKNAKEGKPAYIHIKINNFSDNKFIKYLYNASKSGVKIKLIVRGMFSIVPGIKGITENIEAISIIDKYLEHARYYIFCNNGDELVYISSADLLPRNLDERIEVTCPIYKKSLKNEISTIFNILWKDNVKARILNKDLSNEYKKDNNKPFRAQDEIYKYLKNLHS